MFDFVKQAQKESRQLAADSLFGRILLQHVVEEPDVLVVARHVILHEVR